MIRRTFVPVVALALYGALGALLVGAGVHYTSAVHEARHAREKICAAELRALRARNPYVERYVLPSDACVALEVVTR